MVRRLIKRAPKNLIKVASSTAREAAAKNTDEAIDLLRRTSVHSNDVINHRTINKAIVQTNNMSTVSQQLIDAKTTKGAVKSLNSDFETSAAIVKNRRAERATKTAERSANREAVQNRTKEFFNSRNINPDPYRSGASYSTDGSIFVDTSRVRAKDINSGNLNINRGDRAKNAAERFKNRRGQSTQESVDFSNFNPTGYNSPIINDSRPVENTLRKSVFTDPDSKINNSARSVFDDPEKYTIKTNTSTNTNTSANANTMPNTNTNTSANTNAVPNTNTVDPETIQSQFGQFKDTASDIFLGGIKDTYKGFQETGDFMGSMKNAFSNTDGTLNAARIGGAAMTTMAAGRVLTGGGIYKDRYGNNNLIGVPFL
jgi:hypothetical protein